ncbi:MAG: hypothetical protein M3552_02980 [Planctomycetota bacterium]|nr:hypothetical protein [Planctomycetaceae bacterium]MDQ3329609.1 hypothetical protein [Planctomycetota bacterium]
MAAIGTTDLKLGFLTAIELAGGGYVGGLLVTNRFGRPLEFQCTTPVRPNRTQEILYGTTLRSFVLGELIGKTLVEKSAVKPDVVLTEGDDLLELRSHVAQPVAVVEQNGGLRIGRHSLRFHPSHADDHSRLASSAESVPEQADLFEPFERVREALHETMKASAARV